MEATIPPSECRQRNFQIISSKDKFNNKYTIPMVKQWLTIILVQLVLYHLHDLFHLILWEWVVFKTVSPSTSPTWQTTESFSNSTTVVIVISLVILVIIPIIITSSNQNRMDLNFLNLWSNLHSICLVV